MNQAVDIGRRRLLQKFALGSVLMPIAATLTPALAADAPLLTVDDSRT
jgi:hypothetical protein